MQSWQIRQPCFEHRLKTGGTFPIPLQGFDSPEESEAVSSSIVILTCNRLVAKRGLDLGRNNLQTQSERTLNTFNSKQFETKGDTAKENRLTK